MVDPKTLPPLGSLLLTAWTRYKSNLAGYSLTFLTPWLFAMGAIACVGIPALLEQWLVAPRLELETHQTAQSVLKGLVVVVAVVASLSAQGAAYITLSEDLRGGKKAGVRSLLQLPWGMGPMLGTTVIRALLSVVWSLCCGFPGAVMWHILSIMPAYVVDRQTDAAEAAAATWDAIKGAPLWCIGLGISLGVIRWLGRLTLIGMVVTEPLAMLVELYAVQALFGKIS